MPQNDMPILELKDLSKNFGGLAAIHRLTLPFYPHQLQSIIGPNGAGKTTLFNLITGMFPPDSGQIFFKGEDITRLSAPNIFRRRIVRTFQISSIFPQLTVLKNVQIAAQGRYRTSNSPWGRLNLGPRTIRDLCMGYLEKLRLLDQSEQKAGLLAYGDKRRLEIVMALVSDPEVLLLDEPTAGMSPEETQETAQLIKGLSKTVTVLLVEHDMKVVMGISDRVIVLNRGSILVDGSPGEVHKNPEVRSVYLGNVPGK
ncbi:MAG: high-affinity branched-chain amino acid transporter ATP-binding protein [Deltaproteobacteria bacterium]|nr:high-affinity branched-chain amino acid transporter ATP-binding protein [Deltaproteobacteria bacterium]